MNRRPALLTAAALTAVTVLSLSACGGGGDDSDGNDRIASAGQESKPAKPSPSSSDDGIDRPGIDMPGDVELVFDPKATGDAKTDAVLKDSAEYQRAIIEGIEAQDPKTEAITFYSKGSALLGTVDWVSGFIKDDTTVTGTVRYFDRKVTFGKDGSAGLTYCADESKGYTQDRKTEKTNVTKATENSYVFYNDRLRKNAKGVWQLTSSSSERGSEVCQP
ncbi:Lipoprotein OS=Streptomyces alboniger OX=132473 GN=CP975_13370 PE=4 SV=1 [Streptomyces alboniger]